MRKVESKKLRPKTRSTTSHQPELLGGEEQGEGGKERVRAEEEDGMEEGDGRGD